MKRALLGLVAALLAIPVFASDPETSLELRTPDGRLVKPLSSENQKPKVFVFLMHDCPVTNASAPELARVAAEFEPKGVQFFGIYTSETAAEVVAHRRDYGLSFEALLDPELQLARLVGATRAPEVAIVSPDGTVLYRGRIDDRATKPGTMRAVPRRRDLHLALEAILQGRQPEPRFTNSMGCYLSAGQR